MTRQALSLGILSAVALLALPALAQQGPTGPCSPYRGADGDIPSELPGCARRLRPAPGSLADELEFRRRRTGVDAEDGPASDEDVPVSRKRRARRAGAR